MSRIAIVNQDKCKPNKCRRECINNCPPQSSGKEVIKIVDIGDIEDIGHNKLKDIKDVKKIAKIVESQCIGCNICVKKCPFGAISIVNLPSEKKEDIIHRYGENGFRLYRLPDLKKNMVTGIIGQNGVGKTSLINILSNNIIPNFEKFDSQFSSKQIISKFRGSVLYDYLKQLYNNNLKVSIKPQKIKNSVGNDITVEQFIDFKDDEKDSILNELELTHLLKTKVSSLSGGETQRLLCYNTMRSDADVYVFDEPSNYLDIKQRLTISRLIRELVTFNRYVIVIDHDMSMLDLVADELLILYGKPSAYGIVSNPISTMEGINIYLEGYIKSENVRFREEEFNLKTTIELDSIQLKQIENMSSLASMIEYPSTTIEYDSYKLIIPQDKIDMNSSINVIMSENGNGKSTFIKYIAKSIGVPVSYKEQTLDIRKYAKKGVYPTVRELFYDKIHISYVDAKFINEVIKPLNISGIEDRTIDKLSGGELQKVLLILCLGTPASIYLIDEPSGNLDVENRLTAIKVIKRHILNNNKCAFIIEHDITMAIAFSQEYTSRILLIDRKYEDNQRVCKVSSYLGFKEGITNFLKSLDITMRIAEHNRPRFNKYNSQLDREQKLKDEFYV